MNRFKSIDDAIKYLAEDQENKDSRVLRIIKFTIDSTFKVNDMANQVFIKLPDVFKDNVDGDNIHLEAGTYEAVVVLHLRKLKTEIKIPAKKEILN